MGLNSETKTIGDTTYKVTQLPAGKARKLLVRLYKVAGPAVGKLLEGLDSQAVQGATPTLGDLKMSSVSDALTTLALHISEDDLEYVVDRIIGSASVEMNTDGDRWVRLSKETVDTHFAGKLDEMFRLLGFALEVNYASFFGGAGVGNILEKLTTPSQSQSPSPENSTGQSGVSSQQNDSTQLSGR